MIGELCENNHNKFAQYIHAYTLHALSQDHLSLRYLRLLAEQDFSPAHISLGDLAVHEGKAELALSHYDRAKALRHMHALPKIRKLKSKHGVTSMITYRCLALLQLPYFFSVFYFERGESIDHLFLNFQNAYGTAREALNK